MVRLPQQNNSEETPHKGPGQGFASAVPASQSPGQQGCRELGQPGLHGEAISEKYKAMEKGCVLASLWGHSPSEVTDTHPSPHSPS